MDTRNYETLFILKSDTTEARLAEINKRNEQIVQSYKGKVFHLDNWGKRKFSYPIAKETRGQYFHLLYSANTECVAEIERQMRINDDVVRFISVKLDDEADPVKAYADFKVRLAAHAKREQERAERNAERDAERAARGGGRGGRFDRGDRGDRGGYDRGDRGGDRGGFDRGAGRPEAQAEDVGETVESGGEE